MTITEQIKAEIERRIKFHNDAIKNCTGLNTISLTHSAGLKEDEELLSFLSTLEESEKPMNMDEELNEEIKKEVVNLPFFIRGKDQIAFARHFAQWGAEHLKK